MNSTPRQTSATQIKKIKRISSGVVTSTRPKLKSSGQKGFKLRKLLLNESTHEVDGMSNKNIYEGLNDPNDYFNTFCGFEQVGPWSAEKPKEQSLLHQRDSFLFNDKKTINSSRLLTEQCTKFDRPQSSNTMYDPLRYLQKGRYVRQASNDKSMIQSTLLNMKTLQKQEYSGPRQELYLYKTKQQTHLGQPNPPEIQRIINQYFKQSPALIKSKTLQTQPNSVSIKPAALNQSFQDIPQKQNFAVMKKNTQKISGLLRGQPTKSNFFIRSPEQKQRFTNSTTTSSQEYFSKLSEKIRLMKNSNITEKLSLKQNSYMRINTQDDTGPIIYHSPQKFIFSNQIKRQSQQKLKIIKYISVMNTKTYLSVRNQSNEQKFIKDIGRQCQILMGIGTQPQ